MDGAADQEVIEQFDFRVSQRLVKPDIVFHSFSTYSGVRPSSCVWR
ncbi:hypothetical protein [Paraburkholderia humisilvae]|nr:hypothetical protein [Paraburkholderia humisilvae]